MRSHYEILTLPSTTLITCFLLCFFAGADPTIEDNDHNRPVDLVSDDDAVSRNCLKNAMINRERYMGSAMADMRAPGHLLLHPELPEAPLRLQLQPCSGGDSQDVKVIQFSRNLSICRPTVTSWRARPFMTRGLYLQPVGSRSTLTRSESGTTLTGSLTLSRQNSQESLHSNSSSLYAHILDSSYEKRRSKSPKKEPSSPQHRVQHKRKSREFKRGGPPLPDSDSSVCDDAWERRSLPPGRRSMSVDATDRVKFASLRKPSKHKGKDAKSKELIFARSPFAKKLPFEADSVSLCSEGPAPHSPIAASSPYKGGSVPNSPMVAPKSGGRFQRSTSLVDESEIHSVRTQLRHVTKTQGQGQGQSVNNVRNDVKGNESDTSSLWQVTPNTSLTNALPSPNSVMGEPHPHLQHNASRPGAPSAVQKPNSGPLVVAQDGDHDDSGDAIYENIPADEEDDHVYGNVPSPAPQRASLPPAHVKVAPSPRKPPPPTLKPTATAPISKAPGSSAPSQSKSPDIKIKVSPNQTITISSNPSSPQELREHAENERLPEDLRLRLNGGAITNANESDSDDTFFDDASFDTISESSHGNRLKSPGPRVKSPGHAPPGTTSATVREQREQRGSIAEQLKKVVSDPKLKDWLAEQAARAKQRQDAVGGKVTQLGVKDDDRVDFGQETESSTIKKNPAAKLTRTESLGKGPKPAPNPKPRNLSLRGKNTKEGKTLVVRPLEAPPLPPDEETDDSFDDASFDTLEDSDLEGQQAVDNANNALNDSVQYETMNNLNNPAGKPVPVPRGKSSLASRSRSNTEESRGSQELLSWERVDPKDNDSYYWEHTGTEEFLEAKNKNSPPQQQQRQGNGLVPPPPVHKLLPEAEYIQMHGLVKAQQQHGVGDNTSTHHVTNTNTNSRPLSTFKSPPTSPTIPRSAGLTFSNHSNQTDDNQNLIPTSPTATKGNIFVSIPGGGNLSDALDKPVGARVSDEYEFHKQQLDLNAANPVTIETKIERRLSQEKSGRNGPLSEKSGNSHNQPGAFSEQ